MRSVLFVLLMSVTLLVTQGAHHANEVHEMCQEVKIELDEAVDNGYITRRQASRILRRCYKTK
jgi:ribosomal protein S20